MRRPLPHVAAPSGSREVGIGRRASRLRGRRVARSYVRKPALFDRKDGNFDRPHTAHAPFQAADLANFVERRGFVGRPRKFGSVRKEGRPTRRAGRRSRRTLRFGSRGGQNSRFSHDVRVALAVDSTREGEFERRKLRVDPTLDGGAIRLSSFDHVAVMR